jgi:hypothetical protein
VTTRKSESLLTAEGAGRLYALLFYTYFRKFNLGYLDRIPELEEFQQTAAFSLYHLGRLARNWCDPLELAPQLLIPAVAQRIPEMPYGNLAYLLVRIRLFQPLAEFGLIACRYTGKGLDHRRQLAGVRVTPLFHEFLLFDLSG